MTRRNVNGFRAAIPHSVGASLAVQIVSGVLLAMTPLVLVMIFGVTP